MGTSTRTITTWADALDHAHAVLVEDLRATTTTDRYLHHVLNAPDRIPARASTLPRRVRVISRLFTPVTLALVLTPFAVTFATAPPEPSRALLVTALLVTALTVGLGIAALYLDQRTRAYRDQVWLPVDDVERYRWSLRQAALRELARSTHPAARQARDLLVATTDATEELIRERATLINAIDRADKTSTYVIDRDDVTARLAAVQAKLDEITAWHTAAAILFASPATPQAPVHTHAVPTVLTRQTQADLEATGAALAALAGPHTR